MQCPKCKNVDLLDSVLPGKFAVKSCQECKGTWIPANEYEAWAASQPYNPVVPDLQSRTLPVDFVQSPYDTKAALCPECRRYLSRAKVNLTTPFYVERCMQCRGIWCDYGEWDILERLGLHTTIEELFSNEWQTKTREQKFSEQERRATIDKLGPDVAAQIFALADVLERHPNGDFGVAYLMRRVSVKVQPVDVRKDEG